MVDSAITELAEMAIDSRSSNTDTISRTSSQENNQCLSVSGGAIAPDSSLVS
jgi:hypothetical protein